MDELYIVGLENVISIVKPLIQNGYVVKVMLFAQQEENEENPWDDLIDNNVYCIMYEVQTEQ